MKQKGARSSHYSNNFKNRGAYKGSKTTYSTSREKGEKNRRRLRRRWTQIFRVAKKSIYSNFIVHYLDQKTIAPHYNQERILHPIYVLPWVNDQSQWY